MYMVLGNKYKLYLVKYPLYTMSYCIEIICVYILNLRKQYCDVKYFFVLNHENNVLFRFRR